MIVAVASSCRARGLKFDWLKAAAVSYTHREEAGYGVVREYVGHGIGRDMHEDPNVPNFGRKHTGVKLEAGMVLAIEPMINLGTYKTRQMPDGWLVCTRDGLPSAHFEKTVAITEDLSLIHI